MVDNLFKQFVIQEVFHMTEAIVSKDTKIGDLLQIDAGVAPILMDIGMHCLGCPASQMETIEEAAMVHGIDSDLLVEKINAFISENKANA